MIERNGDRLLVSGDVTIDTVSSLFKQGLIPKQNAGGGANIIVDFARLDKIDSSAVSLMLAWLREAQRGNVTLQFAHIPENLSSLANLYGVAGVLNLEVS